MCKNFVLNVDLTSNSKLNQKAKTPNFLVLETTQDADVEKVKTGFDILHMTAVLKLNPKSLNDV